MDAKVHGSGSSDEDEDTLVRRVAATRKVGDGQRRSVDGEGGAMPSGLQTVDTEVDGVPTEGEDDLCRICASAVVEYQVPSVASALMQVDSHSGAQLRVGVAGKIVPDVGAEPQLLRASEEFVDHLNEKAYVQAAAMIGSPLSLQVGEQKLKDIWRGLAGSRPVSIIDHAVLGTHVHLVLEVQQGVFGKMRKRVQRFDADMGWRWDQSRNEGGALVCEWLLLGSVKSDCNIPRRPPCPEPLAASVHDLWHLGSCGKAWSAVVVGLLVQQGRLDWDASPCSEQCMAFASKHGWADCWSGWESCTLRRLMCHRGGVPGAQDVEYERPWTLAWQQARAGSLPPAARACVAHSLMIGRRLPVDEYRYSNLGYMLASWIVECVCGDTWESLRDTTLVHPLGLSSVGSGPPPRVWGRLDIGADSVCCPPSLVADNPSSVTAAGTLHCCLADWAAVCGLLLGTSYATFDGLSADSVKLLKQPYVQNAADGEDSYGFGWQLVWTGCGAPVCGSEEAWGGPEPVLTHTGSNTMHTAVAWLAPGRDKPLAILAASNAGGANGAKACQRACEEILHNLVLLDTP